jgi:hypothetical protein
LADAVGVSLAALDGDGPAVWTSIQVLDRNGHELRPPQRAEEADQQQGTVPDRGEIFGKGGDDPGQHVYIEGRGTARASTVYLANAPEDLADQRVLGRVRMTNGLVGVSNGREAAP